MEKIVLVLTSAQDRSVEPVLEKFDLMGQKFFRFDTDLFPEKTTLSLGLESGNLDGVIELGGGLERVEFGSIKSCWYRHVAPANVTDARAYSRFIKEESKVALWSLYTSLDAFWMNPPLTGARLLNNNKLYQMKTASSFGIRTPKTLISNNPYSLLDFCRRCGGRLAVKMLSGHVFVREGSTDTMCVYTNLVSEKDLADRVEEISLAPILAQEYISKKLELRITIVGQRVFACEIHSQDSERTTHDWRRYDFDKVKHLKHNLPKKIEERLLRLVTFWGLQFAAIDMIITPEDQYVFLEVNPQGQWGWIEDLTGMPISRAIAELLTNPPETVT